MYIKDYGGHVIPLESAKLINGSSLSMLWWRCLSAKAITSYWLEL